MTGATWHGLRYSQVKIFKKKDTLAGPPNLRRNDGSILIVLIMSLGFIVVLGFTLQGFISRMGDVSRDTTKQLSYKTALNSLLAYTQAGVKRRWCFTEIWTPEGAEECNLANPRSSERLLLSASQITFIQGMIAADPSLPHGTPINLKEFQQTIDIKNLSADHPIREIISGPEFNFLGQIRFTITRLSDADLPVLGSEAHVQIMVELLPAPGKSFPQNRSQMKAWVKVTFFPREMGLFALVVPGDMYLDGSTGGRNGDVIFPATKDPTLPGIDFESPVFVNGHVNIPPANSSVFTNVTFSEPLIIGGGVVKQGNKPASPSSAGSFDGQLSSILTGFGGFQQGTSLDGERDLGLDVFSGLSTGVTSEDEMMKACIDRNKVKSDFMRTAGSSLLVRELGGGKYELSWSKDNYFTDQRAATNLQTAGNFLRPPKVMGGGGAASMNVSVKFTGSSVGSQATFNLGRDGSAQVFPRLTNTSEHYKNRLEGIDPDSPDYDRIKDLFNKSLQAEADPGGVEITTSPVSYNGALQQNRIELQVKLIHPENIFGNIKIEVNGFDMSFLHGETQRTGVSAINFNSLLKLDWARSGNSATSANPALQTSFGPNFTRTDNKPASPQDLSVPLDWNKLEVDCNPATSNSQLAFQPSGWDYSFAPVTRHSWNINPVTGILDLNQSNAALAGPPAFLVKSIADTCVIHATANFVTGFFVCDKLIFEARTQPLRIVGTFIVNSVSIDPSVYRTGLRWSNIYTPNAVVDLRGAKVLKPKWSSCEPSLAEPIWHPFPTISRQDDIYNCNSIFLRAKADPFTWTTMDPDCGLKPGAPSTTCKRRPVRFSAKEFDRGVAL